MTVPGSNTLARALKLIHKQTVTYFKATSRTPNSIGIDVTNYAAGVSIVGSLQPIPKNLYEQMGLDLQKTYFNFYSPNDIIDINRGVSGDQITFLNKRYQCESVTDWYSMDGWKAVLCVLIT